MMTMISFIDNALVCGASSIGKSHIIRHVPNQDYYKIKVTKYGMAMAVCDGVGSHRYSQYGSKAAARAVIKTFKLYYKRKIAKAQIGPRVEYYYRKYLREPYRQEAGTTCLFVFIYENSEIILGQAGDGLILVKLDDKFLAFQEKTDDFLNEVSPLSCSRRYTHWKIRNLRFNPESNKILGLLLCTDGISEDIIPDKREQFFEYFLNLSRQGQSHIQEKLDNWYAPGSVDDKTLITFEWRK